MNVGTQEKATFLLVAVYEPDVMAPTIVVGMNAGEKGKQFTTTGVLFSTFKKLFNLGKIDASKTIVKSAERSTFWSATNLWSYNLDDAYAVRLPVCVIPTIEFNYFYVM